MRTAFQTPKVLVIIGSFLVVSLACALPASQAALAEVATATALHETQAALAEILSAAPTEALTEAPTVRPSPTKAPPLSVTSTPRATITRSPVIGNCTRWDRLSREDVGEEVCVYGIIARIITGGSQSMIFASPDGPLASVEFRFLIINAWYPDIKEGMCVRGEGVLRENGPTSYLFINTDQLWTYDQARACDY